MFELSAQASGYPSLMQSAFRYAAELETRGEKPNFEASIAARFSRAHAELQKYIIKRAGPVSNGSLRGAFSWGGIQHNHVNRLLLMSSSEHHLPVVPLAFYFRLSKSRGAK